MSKFRYQNIPVVISVMQEHWSHWDELAGHYQSQFLCCNSLSWENNSLSIHNPRICSLILCVSQVTEVTLSFCFHSQSLLFCDSPKNLNQITSPIGQIGSCWLTKLLQCTYLPVSSCMETHFEKWHMLFLSCHKARGHKLCFILVQCRDFINVKAWLDPPHQAEETR